jgi:UrcA family protein
MLIASVATAQAQPTDAVAPYGQITYRMAVSYHDLDLSLPAGRARLKHRLIRAVSGVCATSDDVHYCEANAEAGVAPRLAMILARTNDSQLASASRR